MKHAKRLLLMLLMLLMTAGPVLAKEFDLHQAVIDNDIKLVDKLISKGHFIDEIGSRKYGYGSALHLAVREGHLVIAKLLLKRGAQVDVLDPDDLTPLHNAAWNGNLEMTQLLLEAGADINASTYDGDTPLSLAQKNDQPQVTEFLQSKLSGTTVTGTPAKSTTIGDTKVIDVTGTYIADLMGTNKGGQLGTAPWRKRANSNREIKLIQKGNQITGSFNDGKGSIFGEIDGNIIEFDWSTGGGGAGKGKWTVKPDSNMMVGTWYCLVCTTARDGKWSLTRIESDTVPIADVSGTYAIAELTYPKNVTRYKDWYLGVGKDLEITIQQNGSAITGELSGDLRGTIKGVITGNELAFEFDGTSRRGSPNYGEGVLLLSEDSTELNGTFNLDSSHYGPFVGKWNFRKIESD